MKKFILILILALSSFTSIAAERSETCYVYGYLRWVSKIAKYSAKLDFGVEAMSDIENDKGEKLKFVSFLNALNYMSSNDWEVIEVSFGNPNHSEAYTDAAEKYALIRKKMTKAEAAKYSSPKK